MKSLVERFRDQGLEPRSYSGRAMYGKQCVGVSGDRSEMNSAIEGIIGDCLQEAYDRGIEEQENENDSDVYENASLDELKEFTSDLLCYREDQLGLGVVYYWPRIEWEDEDEAVIENTGEEIIDGHDEEVWIDPAGGHHTNHPDHDPLKQYE